MEELQRNRTQPRKAGRKPELMRQIESLQLARTETERALNTTGQARRRQQLSAALADIDQKLTELRKVL